MISMNIRMLRKRSGYTQEQLAEKVDVSRQTVAKWETGEALPNIYTCQELSAIFEVTLEQFSSDMTETEAKELPPKGKQFFGVVKVGERGQVVIPKQARDMYHIQAGDKLVVLGEDATKGLAILKSEGFLELADSIRHTEPTEDESP